MSVSADILKAKRVGMREFKSHVSKKFLNEMIVIYERNAPVSVNVPYEELLELADILDETTDPETLKIVAVGRRTIKAGTKTIRVSETFKKFKDESSTFVQNALCFFKLKWAFSLIWLLIIL